MSRCTRFLGALVLVACAERSGLEAPSGADGCARPEAGCACEPDSPPVACFETDQVDEHGEVVCREGTRHCEGGRWGACRDVRSYLASTRSNVGALINPSATPKTCSICDLQCFELTDPLLAADAGADSAVSYAPGGGLTVGTGDGGTVVASGPVLTGCAGLTQCCDQLQAVPALRAACMSANTGVAAECDDAHRLFCSDVVLPAGTPCVAGANPNDLDCDGIPDLVDRCLPSNYMTEPACAGSTMPLPGNTHPAIFHVLDRGRSASDALQIEYKLRNADVYFLLDTSDTMSEERSALTDSLTMNNVAECALLKNCCDEITVPATKAACMSVANSRSSTAQATCLTRQATYCPAPATAYTDCADTDGNGMPNNELKGQGVAGAISCLVGSAQFGLGEFRDIPFNDGVNYGLDGYDGTGFYDRGDHDEWAFRHHVDMTSDIDRVRVSLESFRTSGNYDRPESSMVALYSVLTGIGHAFGKRSPNVAGRAGDPNSGCLGGTFGYPCFRGNSVPIVLLFTDDPMNNGPDAYNPDFQETEPRYDTNYSVNDPAPTTGSGKYIPIGSDAFSTARTIGNVNQRFEFASGNTRHMKADILGALAGCGAADDAHDAVFRFRTSVAQSVAINLNVAVESPANYQDVYTGITNGPTPTTEFPAVLTLYDSSGGFMDCKTVCPNVPPFNCRSTGASCSNDGQCCSGSCSWFSGKCDGTAPAGTDPCNAAAGELTTTGFTSPMLEVNKDYFVSVKGGRATELGVFEVQVGDSARGSSAKYPPPTWSQVSTAIDNTDARILPVLSCDTFDTYCEGAHAQADVVAEDSGAVDANNNPLVARIDPDGTGLTSSIALSVRDLANHLTMDVTLQATPNDFDVQIQKCTNLVDAAQAKCTALSVDCNDSPPGASNTVRNCKPGAIPRFVVEITNPPAPASVAPNPAIVDPFGGHLFALQLLGDYQVLLDEIPVYIIPTDLDAFGPPVAPFQSSGSYEQPLYGKGCVYNALEGEGPGTSSCVDRLDNDMDGLFDSKDPDCQLGSCLDGLDNDGDGSKDIEDPSCDVTAQQEWTDLYLRADVPFGTSIRLEACAASTQAELAGCSYSPVATVRSLNKSCGSNVDCRDVDLGAGPIDGYCSSGQCQYLDPPKEGTSCTTDAMCPNGTINGKVIESHCDTGLGKCVYVSQPADLGGALAAGERGLPYLQLKVTLNANTALTAAPTLYEWTAQYVCRSNR